MARIEDRLFNTYDELEAALKKEYPHKRIYKDETFATEGVVNITIKYPSRNVAIVACTQNEDATGKWYVEDSVHDEPKEWYK